MQIIGIDCATVDSKVGLAVARYQNGRTFVQDVRTGSPEAPVLDTICSWLEIGAPVLLAMDAPLGWPADLGRWLAGHQAGDPLKIDANLLFRRFTDRFIKEKTGRLPLDVGADRIARTAHAALRLLEGIRQRTGLPVPLTWRPNDIQEVSTIEVYPAATLAVYGMQASGYKRPGERDSRQRILAQLGKYIQLPQEKEIMLANADALDALGCVLAGADYLSGECLPPSEAMPVEKEGWIWVRSAKAVKQS